MFPDWHAQYELARGTCLSKIYVEAKDYDTKVLLQSKTRNLCAHVPHNLNRLAQLFLHKLGLQAVGGRKKVVGCGVLVPRVSLCRHTEPFHANFAF